MKKGDIERINELARKAKTVGLTPEENEERAKLRRAYIDSVVGDLRQQRRLDELHSGVCSFPVVRVSNRKYAYRSL